MTYAEDGKPQADLVESLVNGFLTEQDARAVADRYPETYGSVVSWIREAAEAGDWTRVGKFTNLAAPLRVAGLDGVVQGILDSGAPGCNAEDLVEILGEVGGASAVACLFRVAERSASEDAPAYWLCQKAIASLGEIGAPQAFEGLRRMTASSWPDVVRWHAAAELDIEEELGFDEDRMLA
ncbi:HEAT repeat domain-containing protein [Streptomyces monomycini]|uniref:HEAT repeat domain-containing protein n=1 Tax=Streptomyces monomycini TaxID=371720 RepID=UPI0012FF42C8|nr:HEAT repeat domain-containing protein [Streptomyces monomycini]